MMSSSSSSKVTTTRDTSHQALVSLQMDVGLVDSYLVQLLLPRFVSMLKHIQPLAGMEEVLLHLVTIWFTSTQAPATKALGMNVRDESQPLRQGVTRSKVYKLMVLSLVLPTLYQKLVGWYERSNTTTQTTRTAQVALERRRMLAQSIIDFVQKTVPILRLTTLLSCWCGRSNAPGLAMCLAGLKFTKQESCQQTPPPLNVTYAHRRWLYEELLRTVQSISPYSRTSSFSSLNSCLVEYISKFWKRCQTADDEIRCSLCGSSPISIPYATNCGHLYCYTCLWNAVLDNSRFSCKTCGEVVRSSQPNETSRAPCIAQSNHEEEKRK